MVFIQVVCGPAGSGKSTYCKAIQEHCAVKGRRVYVANLDPAAETFSYDLAFDIRDLISVEEVMNELNLGPNGALLYAMDYLLENLEWLEEELSGFLDDDYLLIDCPGQLELYTHQPVMRAIVDQLRVWGHSRVAGVFVVDATFVCDAPKFISGILLSLSAMISLELPHINVLSKCDLVDSERVLDILEVQSAQELWNIEESKHAERDKTASKLAVQTRKKRNRLTESICTLIDDYSMVGFVPLNLSDEESIDHVMSHVDHVIQYGEDLEVQETEEFGGDADEE